MRTRDGIRDSHPGEDLPGAARGVLCVLQPNEVCRCASVDEVDSAPPSRSARRSSERLNDGRPDGQGAATTRPRHTLGHPQRRNRHYEQIGKIAIAMILFSRMFPPRATRIANLISGTVVTSVDGCTRASPAASIDIEGRSFNAAIAPPRIGLRVACGSCEY